MFFGDILCILVILIPLHSKILPDRMKQKEAGLRKKCTPLLSDMATQMEPMTIMVRLKRAKTAAARFRSVKETMVIYLHQAYQHLHHFHENGVNCATSRTGSV